MTDRISFDALRVTSDQAIDVERMARRICEARGVKLARGVVWHEGSDPVPENARRRTRFFDVYPLEEVSDAALSSVQGDWRMLGECMATASPSEPWQVCRRGHDGGLPGWSRAVTDAKDRMVGDQCNGWLNWDTWNVVAAIDNGAHGRTLDRVTSAAQSMDVQAFAAWLLDELAECRVPEVGAVDVSKLDVRAIHTNYAEPIEVPASKLGVDR